MSKILFVVHRYHPFPGGSEYYVQNMAEEAKSRGHDVTVLAHEFGGDAALHRRASMLHNGVQVSGDYQLILNIKYDMIVVHGGDCISQNVIHQYANQLTSPVLYMIIKPSYSPICMHGARFHKYLAYSTTTDLDYIQKIGYADKARRVRHGINMEDTVKTVTKDDKRQSFVSAGGWSPHKGMAELASSWLKYNIDASLHLFGYYGEPDFRINEGDLKISKGTVHIHKNSSKKEVMQAIAASDGYIMNSSEEGFGLVLLEAMANKVPWYSKKTAGAMDMSDYGTVYNNEDELMMMIKTKIASGNGHQDLQRQFDYVASNHTIVQTVNDIEDVIEEDKRRQ
jgi:glycosyltransferase involved in cell wall biosynthesis